MLGTVIILMRIFLPMEALGTKTLINSEHRGRHLFFMNISAMSSEMILSSNKILEPMMQQREAKYLDL